MPAPNPHTYGVRIGRRRIYSSSGEVWLPLLSRNISVEPLSSTANYTEFKGAMAENAILQSLMPILNRDMPFYWSSDSRAEIELVIQWQEEIIPIEVKAENCISGRSLSVYNERYKPKHRVRFSFQNLLCNCGLLSCPSPLADWLPKLLLMA